MGVKLTYAVSSECIKSQQNPDYADGIWAVVAVDLSKISGKAKRVNITTLT